MLFRQPNIRLGNYTHPQTHFGCPKPWDKCQVTTLLFLRYGAWQCNCHFSFWAFFCWFTKQPKKWKFQKNKKNKWRYNHFTQVYQRSWSYALLFPRYGVWQVLLVFFILGNFLPFYPTNSPKKWKFQKNKKNTWRYNHFTQVYQRSWSYALLFPRYGVWQVLLVFFILGNFLPIYPTNSPKNEKNT